MKMSEKNKIHHTFNRSDKYNIYYHFLINRLRYLFKFYTLTTGFIGNRSRVLGKRNIKINGHVNIGSNVTIDARFSMKMEFGNDFSIRDGSYISSYGSIYSNKSGYLVIGNNVGISENCYIQIRGNLRIEDDVIIGPGTTIITENHIFSESNTPIRLQGVVRKGVVIGNGSWIGANVTILDGVRLGSKTIAAAGTVVTKSFPGNCIIGGIPARELSKLNLE